MNESILTHFNEQGQVQMVDVSQKQDTIREAIGRGVIYMQPATIRAIIQNEVKKGNALETAKIAGIMAAKNTASLIPLCHNIPLTSIDLDFFIDQDKNSITIESRAKTIANTGVEMEALTAVSISALTIYDMCKAMDRAMRISDIVLVKKSGGRSGTFIRSE